MKKSQICEKERKLGEESDMVGESEGTAARAASSSEAMTVGGAEEDSK